MVGALRAHSQGLDRVGQVLRRGRGTCEVHDPVDLSRNVERLDDVVFLERKPRLGFLVGEVVTAARDEVVDSDYGVSFGEEPRAEVTADEAGSTGQKHPHLTSHSDISK